MSVWEWAEVQEVLRAVIGHAAKMRCEKAGAVAGMGGGGEGALRRADEEASCELR